MKIEDIKEEIKEKVIEEVKDIAEEKLSEVVGGMDIIFTEPEEISDDTEENIG